jgi:hypothetical protein
MRRVRVAASGPSPSAVIQARAVAEYTFRLCAGRMRGATSLDEVDGMTVDELRAFLETNRDIGGASVALRMLTPTPDRR